jgi:hypothetical protein
MPDKWEYPWFAAWDWAFHCVALVEVDAEFAKSQLVLLMREWYMHPNGQLPAYEWAFGDVNPPVHAWAAFRVFQIDRRQRRKPIRRRGRPGISGARVSKAAAEFHLVGQPQGRAGAEYFSGRLSRPGQHRRVSTAASRCRPAASMSQADGTSWMAMYCLNLLRIALELAQHNHVYEDIATKFFEHFLSIAAAINGVGEDTLGLWDEDGSVLLRPLETCRTAKMCR